MKKNLESEPERERSYRRPNNYEYYSTHDRVYYRNVSTSIFKLHVNIDLYIYIVGMYTSWQRNWLSKN